MKTRTGWMGGLIAMTVLALSVAGNAQPAPAHIPGIQGEALEDADDLVAFATDERLVGLLDRAYDLSGKRVEITNPDKTLVRVSPNARLVLNDGHFRFDGTLHDPFVGHQLFFNYDPGELQFHKQGPDGIRHRIPVNTFREPSIRGRWNSDHRDVYHFGGRASNLEDWSQAIKAASYSLPRGKGYQGFRNEHNTGGTLVFDIGTYRVSETLYIGINQHWRSRQSHGRANTLIVASADWKGDQSPNPYKFSDRNLPPQLQGTTVTNGGWLVNSSVHHNTHNAPMATQISNVSFECNHRAWGLRQDASGERSRYIGMRVLNPRYVGIMLPSGSNNTLYESCHIHNTRRRSLEEILEDDKIGVAFSSINNNLKFQNVKINNFKTAVYAARGSEHSQGNRTKSVQFANCGFEGSVYAFRLGAGAHTVEFRNCALERRTGWFDSELLRDRYAGIIYGDANNFNPARLYRWFGHSTGANKIAVIAEDGTVTELNLLGAPFGSNPAHGPIEGELSLTRQSRAVNFTFPQWTQD